MTPPGLNQATSQSPMSQGFDVAPTERPEQVCTLTFDEQRELPMPMVLGLDLSALD